MCYGQILESGLRKARKEHKCVGCERTIRKGVEYERVTGKDGGEFWTSKWHKKCIAIADVAEPFDVDGCMVASPKQSAYDYVEEAGWRSLLREARRMLAVRNKLWGRK